MSEFARPLDLATLPRVSARAAAASRLSARALATLPWRTDVDLPPVGPMTFTVIGPALEEALPPEHVALGLSRGGLAGRLTIDGGLAEHLLRAVLGGEAAPCARRLSVGERGVLAGQLAAVLNHLGIDLGVSLSLPPQVHDGCDIAARVVTSRAAGWLRLEVPPSWLAVAWRMSPTAAGWTARAAHLNLEARVELAVTHITASDLTALAVGDAVVFDGAVPVGGDGTTRWRARVLVGRYGAVASVGADGAITVEDRFRPVAPPAARITYGKDKENEMCSPDSFADAAAVLAGAPVEVVAEIGRLTLRGDEILGLAPGVVLSLGNDRARAVVLRVGGEIWAEGELVDVDGELGVRVTTLARPGGAGVAR